MMKKCLERNEIILLAEEEIKINKIDDEDEVIEIIENMSQFYPLTEEEEWDYALKVLLSNYCK